MVPRKIFVLWLQGEAAAPPLVKMCLLRWRRLNPGYELKVLDLSDAKRILSGFPMDVSKMRPQALSDVLRIRLLRDQGGVWADATTFPILPLDYWLPDATSTGFFAFQGHRRPLDVDSWLIAAEMNHIIPRLWWQEIERYWSRPRKLITFSSFEANYNFDPLSFFRSDRQLSTETYPYYWVMYIFSHLLLSDSDFRSAWARVPKRSSTECHAIQLASSDEPEVSDRELVQASLRTPVQKLSHRSSETWRWLRLDAAFHEHDLEFPINATQYEPYQNDCGEMTLYDRAKWSVRQQVGVLGSRIPWYLRPPWQ
ncbi:capsular polysaccharide synthesis protein [Pseudarthrobacter sp. NamB4]|uniref:capsular polysaccharide synthesis protein n=1 Tax=Pseudarthrobacter sp. NamB4 TaxID=2576837 RepID=UPI001485605D|nr:capsular polysaccharide synthesis protein [Pseudarthrobacter sp. NamB4]